MRGRTSGRCAIAALAVLGGAACGSMGATASADVTPLPSQEPLADPLALRGTEAQIAAGARLFAETCAVCHGQNAIGGVKDLRHMTPDTHAKFNAIVLDGLYLEKGMASFSDILTPEQAEQIHHYLVARANENRGER